MASVVIIRPAIEAAFWQPLRQAQGTRLDVLRHGSGQARLRQQRRQCLRLGRAAGLGDRQAQRVGVAGARGKVGGVCHGPHHPWANDE